MPTGRPPDCEIAPAYVTYKTAMAYTSLSRDVLKRAVRRGELTPFRFGGYPRFSLAELDAWVQSHRQGGAQ